MTIHNLLLSPPPGSVICSTNTLGRGVSQPSHEPEEAGPLGQSFGQCVSEM